LSPTMNITSNFCLPLNGSENFMT